MLWCLHSDIPSSGNRLCLERTEGQSSEEEGWDEESWRRAEEKDLGGGDQEGWELEDKDPAGWDQATWEQAAGTGRGTTAIFLFHTALPEKDKTLNVLPSLKSCLNLVMPPLLLSATAKTAGTRGESSQGVSKILRKSAQGWCRNNTTNIKFCSVKVFYRCWQ